MKALFAAGAQRILAVLALCLITHMSWELILHLRDGDAYYHWALAFTNGHFSQIPMGDRQYFIGYPMALSFFLRILPPLFAFHTLQLLSLAGIFWYGKKVFPESVILWLTFATPMFLLFSNLNMTENLVLCLLFFILYSLHQKQFLFAALGLGFGLLVRPQLFVFLGAACVGNLVWNRNSLKVFLIMVIIPAIFAAGLFLFNQKVFGDALQNFHLYARQEASRPFLQIPFLNFFLFMRDPSIPHLNKLYVGGCFLFAGFGLGLFIRKKRRESASFTYSIFAILYFVFIMTVSYRWAFLEIPRYMIPLYPAAWEAFGGKWLKNRYLLAAGAVLSFIFAVYFEASGDSLKLLM